MKDSRALSSVQALDDYFDALLDEDDQPQLADTDAEPLLTDAAIDAVPKLQAVTSEPENKFSGAILTKEQRDLSSVEKLLSQLQLDEDMEVEVMEVTDAMVETQTDIDVSVDVETAQETRVECQVDVVVEQAVEVETEVTEAVDTELAVETDTALEEPQVVEEVVTETLEAEAVDETVAIEEEVAVEATSDSETEMETESGFQEDTPPPWKNIVPEHGFQVLFFESFGVTYAVPLAELGGIHRLEECNHLIGRPDWYLGLQTERDQQLDIVDTAKWVMPEKITDNSHRDGYSYIVLLGDSKWGLACNALLGTESLNGEQVRWREQAGKRPWLAGLVKQKMCALIHVEALITMLNQGIDANALA